MDREGFKICTRCIEEKPLFEFRIRKGRKSRNEKDYPNPTCKKCDAEISREYYQRKREDPEFMKINSQRTNEYQKRTEYAKKRWKKDKKKMTKKVKEWRKANQKRHKENQKRRSLKYHDKNRDEVTDAYCISKIKSNCAKYGKPIPKITKDLIEIKRAEILTKRIRIKLHKDGKK